MDHIVAALATADPTTADPTTVMGVSENLAVRAQSGAQQMDLSVDPTENHEGLCPCREVKAQCTVHLLTVWLMMLACI